MMADIERFNVTYLDLVFLWQYVQLHGIATDGLECPRNLPLASETSKADVAITRRLQRLEIALGGREGKVTLIERKPGRGKGKLTKYGKELLRWSQKVIHHYGEMPRLSGGPRLVVGTTSAMGSNIVSLAVGQTMRATGEKYRPQITLEIADPRDCYRKLHEGEIDIAILPSGAAESADFKYHHFHDDDEKFPLVIAAPSDSDLAMMDSPIELDELANQRLVVLEDDIVPGLPTWINKRLHISRRLITPTTNFDAALALVRAGSGIAFVPGFLSRLDDLTKHGDIIVRPIKNPFDFQVSAYHRPELSSTIVPSFIKHISNQLKSANMAAAMWSKPLTISLLTTKVKEFSRYEKCFLVTSVDAGTRVRLISGDLRSDNPVTLKIANEEGGEMLSYPLEIRSRDTSLTIDCAKFTATFNMVYPNLRDMQALLGMWTGRSESGRCPLSAPIVIASSEVDATEAKKLIRRAGHYHLTRIAD